MLDVLLWADEWLWRQESQPINCSGTASHGQLARPNLASQRLAEVALEAHLILGQCPSSGMLQDRITKHISEPGRVAGIHEDKQRLASHGVGGVAILFGRLSLRKEPSNSRI